MSIGVSVFKFDFLTKYKDFAKACPMSRSRTLICDKSKLVSEIFLLLDQNSFENSLAGYVNNFYFGWWSRGMVCGMKQIALGQVTSGNLEQEGNQVRNSSLKPTLQTAHALYCFKS